MVPRWPRGPCLGCFILFLLLAGEEAPPEKPPTVPYRKPGNCVVSLPVSMLVALENSETGH